MIDNLPPHTAVVVLSHGSLLCGADRTVSLHVARLRESLGMSVCHAFLNYIQPSFLSAVEQLAAVGNRHLIVVPYFLVAGKFVTVDVQAQVDEARATHPNLRIEIAEVLGTGHEVAAAVVESALAAAPTSCWSGLRNAARQYCRHSPDCPLYETCRALPISQPEEAILPTLHVPKSNRDVLLVLAHGSPRPSTALTIQSVATAAAQLGGFEKVEVGFLDCNEPNIPDAVSSAIYQAADQGVVRIAPLFLHAGNHTANDIPEIVLQTLECVTVPHTVLMGPPVGEQPGITRLLSTRASEVLVRLF